MESPDLQPDADPVLEDSLVLDLVRRFVPDARAVLSVDESGGEARAYMVDEDLVLKTQRPYRLRPRTSVEKEARFLDELGRANVSVPRNLGYGREAGVEFLVLTRMPGIALATAGRLPWRARSLTALGRTMRAIHSIDQSFAASELFPGDLHATDLRSRLATTLENVLSSGSWSDQLLDGLTREEVVIRLLDATPTDMLPVALHANPGPSHMFVDPASGEFTGLIDFADAFRSHPALDLAAWPAEDLEPILAGYVEDGPLPDTFEAALHLGRLNRILNSMLKRLAREGGTTLDVEAVLTDALVKVR